MNERDSEAVAAQLLAKGYTLAPSENVADVVLLNTCSVRDMAERKALNKMRALAADSKRYKRNVVFGFLGCMAQSRGKELIDRLPDVDLVLGTQKFHRAAEYLDEILSGKKKAVVDVEEEEKSEGSIKEHLVDGQGARSVTGFVSIMQGCNQYCTFCIVPYTRGQERSRTIEEIVAECRQLAADGVKEITLLGQIVTSYGKRMIPTLNGKSAFVQLLDAVHEIEGLQRIRFTSPHPKGYGDDLVEAYGRLPKLVESAHLPVQSGSDRVLKLMHRGYTRARFMEIVGKLRAVQPGIGITSDIISGFPGETEEDFQESLSLIREVQFDQAYVYKYSERRDTPAASMPNQVPLEMREERNARMLEVLNEVAAKRYEAMVGKRVEILVEGPSKRNPKRLAGRTRCNKIVVFDGDPSHVGQILRLDIVRSGSFTLYGVPISPK